MYVYLNSDFDLFISEVILDDSNGILLVFEGTSEQCENLVRRYNAA